MKFYDFVLICMDITSTLDCGQFGPPPPRRRTKTTKYFCIKLEVMQLFCSKFTLWSLEWKWKKRVEVEVMAKARTGAEVKSQNVVVAVKTVMPIRRIWTLLYEDVEVSDADVPEVYVKQACSYSGTEMFLPEQREWQWFIWFICWCLPKQRARIPKWWLRSWYSYRGTCSIGRGRGVPFLWRRILVQSMWQSLDTVWGMWRVGPCRLHWFWVWCICLWLLPRCLKLIFRMW